MKGYFNCGSVGINRKDATSTRHHYRVKSVKHLIAHIIPFFEQHSLKTQKQVEFRKFRRICILMEQGYHRQSLANFLEVYDLGQTIRGPKRGNKNEKVLEILTVLRNRLEQDPTLK